MKLIFLTFVTVMVTAFSSHAASIDLTSYQESTGAILVAPGGDGVDPYFATKALLIARDGGIDINSAGKKWIRWALAYQDKSGLFSRYCRASAGVEWKVCAKADADDALLALWIRLLYALAPDSGMPVAWQRSVDKAKAQLDLLYNEERGIYHISSELPVGLLMDNVEVYAAFRSISHDMKRLGHQKSASGMLTQARKLRESIYHQFWDENKKRFRITTQPREEDEFYPDHVAQLFPILYQLPAAPYGEDKHYFQKWIRSYKDAWFEHIAKDYAWGLVAVTATLLGDSNTAWCWQNKAEPFRHSRHWNVLEEAALQRVHLYLRKHKPTVSVACMAATS